MMPEHAPRILIAAGGTAGHVAPALEVARELRSAGANISFLISPRPLDKALVTAAGYDSTVLEVGGLPRRLSIAALQALGRAALAVPRSMRIIRESQADAVLTGGGFVCAPTAVAAWLCRIPIVATEADRHLGLANRVASLFARRFCTAYPLPQRRRKQQVTGRPVGAQFGATTRADARHELGLPEDAIVVLSTGATNGAARINDAMIAAFSGADGQLGGRPCVVLHLAGIREFEHVRTEAPSGAWYRVIDFTDDMATYLAAADVVVSRAGGTVFELAAAGCAAILIPSPNVTGRHQHANAEYFARHGAVVVLDDSDLTGERLLDYIRTLVDPSHAPDADAVRDRLRRRMRALARPAAARDIASIVLQVAAAKTGSHSVPAASTDHQPLRGTKLHMLGAGGAGVSGLARLAQSWGAQVSGCDQATSTYLERLGQHGVDVRIGHDPAHISAGMTVVRSSALAEDHPELVRAQELGCRVVRRGEFLGDLTRLSRLRSVVVAGAHGKSTTTSMIGQILLDAGVDATVLVGADVPRLGGNVHVGREATIVLEGDESDRTLAQLRADVAVVTNIELDHHTTYASEAELVAFFEDWVRSLGRNATLVLGPGVELDGLARVHTGPTLRVPADETADPIKITLPGAHNRTNARCALAAASVLGIDQRVARSALQAFSGLGRRFELVGVVDDVEVRDEYSHHPTEVAAGIRAAAELIESRGGIGRVIIVFQPHLYSRTEELAVEFGTALCAADAVFVLPIYGAREAPRPGVTSQLIIDAADGVEPGLVRSLEITPATGDLTTITSMVRPGDVIVTMGAGDITRLGPRVLAALREAHNGT